MFVSLEKELCGVAMGFPVSTESLSSCYQVDVTFHSLITC